MHVRFREATHPCFELRPTCSDGYKTATCYVCCSVLQCVAVCCSVLQCVAVCCSVLQCVAVCIHIWDTRRQHVISLCSKRVRHTILRLHVRGWGKSVQRQRQKVREREFGALRMYGVATISRFQ